MPLWCSLQTGGDAASRVFAVVQHGTIGPCSMERLGSTMRLMKMRPRGRATIGATVCATLLLVTGCAASISSTRSKPQPVLLPSSAPSRAPLTEPLVKTAYGSWGFTVSHPVAWRSYPFEKMGSLGDTIGFLSTDIVRDPCAHTASSISCGEAVERLSPTGVLISWGNDARPVIRSISAFPGESITVGGSEARLEPAQPATGACLAMGGAIQLEGTVVRPASNFLRMGACIGPDANVTAGADVEAMFRSLTFTGR